MTLHSPIVQRPTLNFTVCALDGAAAEAVVRTILEPLATASPMPLAVLNTRLGDLKPFRVAHLLDALAVPAEILTPLRKLAPAMLEREVQNYLSGTGIAPVSRIAILRDGGEHILNEHPSFTTALNSAALSMGDPHGHAQVRLYRGVQPSGYGLLLQRLG